MTATSVRPLAAALVDGHAVVTRRSRRALTGGSFLYAR